ncbi:hypothetical protein U27_06462 [Candidatus Vecturithrix granuli]|uniref:Uncharacterized protein n=1 Tax=Vecturithrix granuli TaxID=1499967 RepID=A0A081C4H2_VECG1|nr:hypothetical protein U27_06462 [Candidatus Vecturithrix granuli]
MITEQYATQNVFSNPTGIVVLKLLKNNALWSDYPRSLSLS